MIKRSRYAIVCIIALLLFVHCAQRGQLLNQSSSQSENELDYTIRLDIVSSGYDGVSNWFHPHAGVIPGKTPTIILTMQKWLIARSDVFFALSHLRSNNLGVSWSAPKEHTKTLGRRAEGNGVELGMSDFTPKWHAKSGVLLGTGHSARYKDNHLISDAKRSTAWAVYNTQDETWSDWRELTMPDLPMFFNGGAGSTQRVDLPNGDILLPIYFKAQGESEYSASIVRCRFIDNELKYVEHGDVLTYPTGRGFAEPSLTYFKNRFFLTLRNNDSAYVASSSNGLHFSKPKVWRFDDGQDLGSYNTQQHWVTHSDGLFLVYTRRGANNNNVVRHRAPLFIAKVDADKLVIRRESEKILVPNKGAQLGNFGVVNINEKETWITTSEGMSEAEPKKYGADGRVYAARLIWSSPNRNWDKY